MKDIEQIETASDRLAEKIILALMLCAFIAMMQGYI